MELRIGNGNETGGANGWSLAGYPLVDYRTYIASTDFLFDVHPEARLSRTRDTRVAFRGQTHKGEPSVSRAPGGHRIQLVGDRADQIWQMEAWGLDQV